MTDAPADDLPLAAEFPAATREQWLKLVEGVLKGAPFDKRLVAKTYDGLAIEPLYGRAAHARPVAGRAPGAPWSIMQRVDHPDPAAANAEALHDLENGATGLSLVFAGAVGAYGYGLAADEEAMARALDGVHLDAGIALDLDLGAQTKDAGRQARRAGEAPRHRARPPPTSASASIRSAPRRRGGGSRCPGATSRRSSLPRLRDLAAQGFRGPFALRRRARDPQRRRLGGAGARLRARGGRRLSARARSRRASRSMPRAA